MLSNDFPANSFTGLSQSQLNAALYGMGIAIGDYDQDGDFDYYVTNIGSNFLFQNDGNQVFEEVASLAGVENSITPEGKNTTGWGTFFFDYDNDTYLDLFVSNGFVPAFDFLPTSVNDPNKLYKNQGDGTFTDLSDEFNLSDNSINRGSIFGDYDNDGDLDFFVVTLNYIGQGVKSLLYNNQENGPNNWLKFKLEGTSSNRDAIGTRLLLFTGDKKLIREIGAGSSHASQNTNVIHFGLGIAPKADSLWVIWPGGFTQVLYDIEANQTIFFKEGENNYKLAGCTDPRATNYDSTALHDFGCTSCPYWFKDVDQDGFGDPENSTIRCEQPVGYMSDNSDCNDDDPLLNPNTIWYADQDSDGYGDPGITLIQCEVPVGFVLNGEDCDDSSPNSNYHPDVDGDGFGDPDGGVISCSPIPGYVQNNLDCDDNDPDRNPTTTWYQDIDKDGFGSYLDSVKQCLAPTGYVLNDLDCDDTDPDVFPGGTALPDGKDNDCDGNIDKVDQFISFDPLTDKNAGAPPFTIEAFSSSGLDISFKITQGPASLSGNVVSLIGLGIVKILASQSGNMGYHPAPGIEQSFCANPAPSISFDKEKGVLSTDLFDSYQWFLYDQPINNADQSEFVVLQSGYYWAEVEINGCKGRSDTLDIIITGLDYVMKKNKHIAFPNPFSNEIHFLVESISLQDPFDIFIYSMAGELVGSLSTSREGLNHRATFQISSLPAGLYLYSIQGNGVPYSGIIEKDK